MSWYRRGKEEIFIIRIELLSSVQNIKGEGGKELYDCYNLIENTRDRNIDNGDEQESGRCIDGAHRGGGF